MRIETLSLLLAAASAVSPRPVAASGHGPVFGLATPTNPKGGWSFDSNFMVRGGDGFGAMLRPALGYGLTENFKVSVSAPVVFKAEAFAASRMSAFTLMSGDFEGLAIWRFHRQDTGVGSRFESGATYQRYASSERDRRPDLLFYSLAYAYAYRPPSWRTDSGWDWRIFGEMTGG